MLRGCLRVLVSVPLMATLFAGGCDPVDEVRDPVLAPADGSVPTAFGAREGCHPISRVPVIGEDPFCPSVHEWLGSQSEPRRSLLAQCTHWQVCDVAYVADGYCYHCADVSSSPHYDD